MPNEYPNFDEYIAIAEQGDASAQHNLAYLYATGERDTPKDNKKAIFWYTKAAEQGCMFAQFSLGFSYLIGKYDNADIIVNLTELDLGCNRLTELPKEITNLVNLTWLGLNDNRLTELPKEQQEWLDNIEYSDLF